jgi:hypothetical protein
MDESAEINKAERSQTEEIPDERWYQIYFLVIVTNAILLFLFWLFSKHFSS